MGEARIEARTQVALAVDAKGGEHGWRAHAQALRPNIQRAA